MIEYLVWLGDQLWRAWWVLALVLLVNIALVGWLASIYMQERGRS